MYAKSAECPKKAVEFPFGLRVASLTVVPRDGAKASRTTLAVCAVLREDPAYAARRRVDAHVDRKVGGVVDGDEGGGVNDGVLEVLHGLVVFFSPDERLPFACEINERTSKSRIVFDPDAHKASSAQKGADISER